MTRLALLTTVALLALLAVGPSNAATYTDHGDSTVTVTGTVVAESGATIEIQATGDQATADAMIAALAWSVGYQDIVPCGPAPIYDESGILQAAGPSMGSCSTSTSTANPQPLHEVALRGGLMRYLEQILSRYNRHLAEQGLPDTDVTLTPGGA